MRGNSFASQEGFAIPPAGFGAAGALALVENHDFAAAATSFTFSGLDGDTDEVYLLAYRIIKAGAGTMQVDLRPNGVTTGQETRNAYNGTGGAGNNNSTTLRITENGSANAGDIYSGWVWIDAKSGVIRTIRASYSMALSGGGGVYFLEAAGAWSDTAANITSIDVVSTLATGIGIGSYLRLYKLQKV
jgi:hypothetical protein